MYSYTKISHCRPINVVDNMVKMLEQHAEHLEEQVANRTQELHEEKKKTDALLYSILPKHSILLLFTHISEINCNEL